MSDPKSPDNGMKYTGSETGYNPKADPDSKNKYFTGDDKALLQKAFNDGRAYERSLFADVLNTIVLEVKRYRQASSE